MIKNTSGQKWTVFAFNRSTGEPVTGDAENITANIRIDDNTASAISDTNPTEQEDGYYVFDLTTAETNGIKLSIFPESVSGGVQVIGCPPVIYTDTMSYGSNAVAINIKDDAAANVVDCYVEIWDSAGTSFISKTTTNSSGNVYFNLDSGTYTVKMHKTGYYFSNQTLIVDAAESVAYTGTILVPIAPADPTVCKIYGYYFAPDGSTFGAVKSMIKLTVIHEATDNNFFMNELTGTYNTSTGELYFNVIQGADVVLEIPLFNIKKRFTVPAQSLYKISDAI